MEVVLKRFNNYLSLFQLTFIILFNTFLFFNLIFAQQRFSAQVFSALLKSDESELTSMLKSNRLLVKPLVDSLLTAHIQEDLSGKNRQAKTNLHFA